MNQSKLVHFFHWTRVGDIAALLDIVDWIKSFVWNSGRFTGYDGTPEEGWHSWRIESITSEMSVLVWAARHIIIINLKNHDKVVFFVYQNWCWGAPLLLLVYSELWEIDQSSGYINEYFCQTLVFLSKDFLYCTYYTWRRLKNGSAKMFNSKYTKNDWNIWKVFGKLVHL